MNKTNLACAALALAVTGVVVPSTVLAQGSIVVTGEPRPTATVSYADLNLRSEDGVGNLKHRVRRAANQLCLEHRVPTIGARLAGRVCRDDALAGAQGQIAAAINNAGSQSYAAAQTIVVALK